MELVFASSNLNKIREVQILLPKSITLLTLSDINCSDEIEETAATIEGNAILKANYIANKYGIPCFADDSGLEVDALNGAPGVYSARYAGDFKDDNLNMEKLLQELKGKPNRNAQFKTVIALQIHDIQETFKGIVKGSIGYEKMGTNGFGYDPIFIPQNFSKTFAELSLEEKNNLSHRSIAVKKLISFLETIQP